ncbi:hypothetical protein [Patulibacter defluvii]|uniref:hypothetical protein n=1 Tax=Patulibacter defluvii TaxID=3095358 RepID=UPI002A74E5B8|nr:hypothetical protein [Patulibacter sp. DM4]
MRPPTCRPFPRRSTVALATAAGLLAAAAPASAASSPLTVSAKDVTVPSVGASLTAKITVRNRSRSAIRSLTLRVSPGSGAKVTPARTRLRTALKGRRSRTVKVSVRLTRAVAGPVRVRLTASGRRVRGAKGSFGVRLRGTSASNPFQGRYFYRVIPTGTTTTNPGIFFTSGSFAFEGSPDGGVPACTAAGPGCVPYAVDGGSLRVDGQATALLDGGHRFERDGVTYLEAAIPAAGARLDLVGTAYGEALCSCWTGSQVIKLDASGRFGYPDSEGGTLDGLPPARSGRYAIGERGTLTLTHGDGRVEKRLLALPLYPNPSANFQPNPAVQGFLLDATFVHGPDAP